MSRSLAFSLFIIVVAAFLAAFGLSLFFLGLSAVLCVLMTAVLACGVILFFIFFVQQSSQKLSKNVYDGSLRQPHGAAVNQKLFVPLTKEGKDVQLSSAEDEKRELEGLKSSLTAAEKRKEQDPNQDLVNLLVSKQTIPTKIATLKDAATSSKQESASMQFTDQRYRDSDPRILLKEFEDFRTNLAKLITEASRALSLVDRTMMGHLQSNTASSIKAVINVRRIVTSLEKRLQEVDQCLTERCLDIDRILYLMHGEMVVEKDSLTALIDSQRVPPLKPEEWRSALASLFKYISRKKDLFKGVDLGFNS